MAMQRGMRRAAAIAGLGVIALTAASPAAQKPASPEARLKQLGAPEARLKQLGAPEARLKELGIQLPPAPKPIASYVPAVRTGNLVFLAGQGPVVDGKATITGKVGAEVTEAEANKAARATMLTLLAVLRAEIGSLDRVRRVVKLVGWVNSAPGFTRQPWVINGASDLLIEVFGEAGRHARTSVGANELPLNIPVEIDLIVEVAPDSPGR